MASSASPSDDTYNTKNYENPFPAYWPLHELFEEIITEKRDLIIIIDDMMGRRGTGKTALSLKLAAAMDQTPEGITTDKAFIQPEKLRNAYSDQSKRSGLVLDETEIGASNRDAMTNVNKALREIMSIGRVREKYVVLNAPLRQFIDTDLQKLADVWIGMWQKGLGLVHFLNWETYSGTLLKPKTQWLPFSDVEKGTQLRQVYNHLNRKKNAHIDGESGDKFVPADTHEEKLRKAREEARQQQRNEIIQRIWTHEEIQEGVTQRQIGEALGLSQQRVAQIIRGNS